MKKKNIFYLICGFILLNFFSQKELLATSLSTDSLFLHGEPSPKWGFFGHKKINRMAVFTLPPELIGLYKQNIEYITEHAVDPDKRRYANRFEGARHFMDLDRYGKPPFDNLPRAWTDALMHFVDVFVVTEKEDTIKLIDYQKVVETKKSITLKTNGIRRTTGEDSIVLDLRTYRGFILKNVEWNYFAETQAISVDSLRKVFPNLHRNIKAAYYVDHLGEHGILPYNLERMQKKLSDAFKKQNVREVLRLSAEIGHYIGDAHVPLHTTANYNGQLTGQTGLHGFWESRIPELFAEKEYDFFVGKASYFENKRSNFWKIVLDSHSYVDSVLLIEKKMSLTFPSDQQYCFDDRLGLTIRTQCRDYARAYSNRMQDMVQQRMQASIQSVGSAWLTAWIDAGQPDISKFLLALPSAEEIKDEENLEKAYKSGSIKGREHDN